ncbi:lipopolysaccharide biosynthesis protein [Desulfonema magnum]|uniref:Polysaccharide biosynthesis protein n=1 Tax=Desulfonema magnum TaxID=45655 RepID=A0A975BXG5_9BACT|nr:oligosaccharide flippase family protein [Desulfonema magnum]QTA93606.1 putative polysaccharide biosynthesis protein [Desulfonema magnum]
MNLMVGAIKEKFYSGVKLQSVNFTSAYFLLMFLGSAINLCRSLTFAKILDVNDFGYLALFNTFVSYGTILFQFGLLNGLNRELPVALGRGENERAIRLRNMVLTLVLMVIMLLFPLFAATLWWIKADIGVKIIYLAAYGGSAISVLYGFVTLELRGRQLLLPFSFIYVLQAVATLLIGIIAGFYCGFKGVIASVFLGYIISIVIAMIFWIGNIHLTRIKFQEIKYLLHIGVPLVLSTFCFTFALSMDRLFIAKYLGMFELGKYQFASVIFIAGTAVSGVVAQCVSPQILYNYGKGTDPEKNFSVLLKIMGGICVISLLGWYPFIVSLNFLLERFFCKYFDTLPILKIFYFSASITIMNVVGVMINVFNKQFMALGYTVIVTSVLFFAYLLAVKTNSSLITFSKIFLFGQIMFVVMNTGLSYWCIKKYK